ncbi:RHS repeat domain-containing protein, partial [Pseudomonas aeruginosa]
TFTYDERGLLKTRRDNQGNLTTYEYNERGLEILRTEAAGTAQARTIATDWHPRLALPVRLASFISSLSPSHLLCYRRRHTSNAYCGPPLRAALEVPVSGAIRWR